MSAPFYKWIVCRSLVRFLLNRQCSGKSRDFRLGASLYYLVGETALSWGGAVGHFGSWPMEGQSSTSRSGWGHHRGPVSTGGGFLQRGKTEVPLFVSLQISQSHRQWKYQPQHPPWSGEWGVGPGFQSSSGVDSPVIILERYSLSWSGES